MPERALIGAVLAGLIVAIARRFGTLSRSGQWAAFAVGVASAAAGWPWAALLVAYFAAASALTRSGGATKAARTRGTLPPVEARSATQVFANGGVFALLALVARSRVWSPWGLAACGALAAASADTWATEIGIGLGGRPRSIVTGAAVAPGMSGGVTVIGTLAAAAGAAFIAYAATAVDAAPLRRALLVVGGAGLAGAVVDSIVGAAVQARRWCDACGEWTERRVHACGYRTTHAAGRRWCSNDLVNLLATIAGGAGAVALGRLVP